MLLIVKSKIRIWLEDQSSSNRVGWCVSILKYKGSYY